MKGYASDFVRRGLTACGFGPLVLAVLYLILQYKGEVRMLTVNEVCMGIFSLSALAFVAGGMNVIYQLERLPLAVAILIHGCVLYVSYLATYLVNDWLEWGKTAVTAFTVIFAVGYLAVWAVIYSVTKRKTEALNRLLEEKNR